MNARVSPSASRCFEPFLDPIDGVVCLPAEVTAGAIAAWAEPHRLRFPLLLDADAPLRTQVNAASYAPASSRFGPFCDNILGMNWKLPNSAVVRIGERVVKTTTGYDLFRFLLHSGERFGRPLDYVLRLRPACELHGSFLLTGDPVQLRSSVAALLKTCWMHWFDSVDLIAQDGTAQLRIAVNCPVPEWPLFETFVSSFAARQDLTCRADRDASPPLDGCPDLTLKTTPEHAAELTLAVATQYRIRCVGLCGPGVVHGYLADGPSPDQPLNDIIREFGAALQAIGGDCHSRHLPPILPSAVEGAWIETLKKESTSL